MPRSKYVVGRRHNGGIAVQTVKKHKQENSALRIDWGNDTESSFVALRSIEVDLLPGEAPLAAKLRAAYHAGAAEQPWHEIHGLVEAALAGLDWSTFNESFAEQVELVMNACAVHIADYKGYQRLTCFKIPSVVGGRSQFLWSEEAPENGAPFLLVESAPEAPDDEQIELPL